MSDEITYPQTKLALVRGDGGPTRKRTPQQKAETRRRARRDAHTTVVQLSDYMPRPLRDDWKDARKGKQRWLGNIMRHIDEVIDSPEPPPFHVVFAIAEVLAWVIVDGYEARGIPVDLPDPPTPIQRALLRRAA